MRHPRPACSARVRAQRWGLWVVLVLLVLVPASLCQSATSSAATEHAPAVAAHCDGDVGHDVLCARGLAATVAPSARGGRGGAAPDVLGVLIMVTALGVALGATLGPAARHRATSGPPPWAPQRQVPGRHQLIAIGITRV